MGVCYTNNRCFLRENRFSVQAASHSTSGYRQICEPIKKQEPSLLSTNHRAALDFSALDSLKEGSDHEQTMARRLSSRSSYVVEPNNGYLPTVQNQRESYALKKEKRQDPGYVKCARIFVLIACVLSLVNILT